ncbi:MAG: hypothetical protein U1F59_05685 [Candidatus Competibacteraceae bacterium]|jgi:hypothetical protein
MIQHARFNLNDIAHEPSDEQLDALMEAVATEARKHAETAREQLMIRLRAEMTAVDFLRTRA